MNNYIRIHGDFGIKRTGGTDAACIFKKILKSNMILTVQHW